MQQHSIGGSGSSHEDATCEALVSRLPPTRGIGTSKSSCSGSEPFELSTTAGTSIATAMQLVAPSVQLVVVGPSIGVTKRSLTADCATAATASNGRSESIESETFWPKAA